MLQPVIYQFLQYYMTERYPSVITFTSTHFTEARTEVLKKLNKILHCLNHFCNCQIVQHPLAFSNNLPHFRLIKTKQQSRCSLQNASGAFNKLLSINVKFQQFNS